MLYTLFPQVTQWEVGNEWNSDTFLHPVGWIYGQPGFTDDEKMDKRFELVYVDYPTQKRIPKDSAYWYRDIIKANGENL